MNLRRNSIIKRLMCRIRGHSDSGDWDLLVDLTKYNLIIYRCYRCGYIDVIDYEREQLDN